MKDSDIFNSRELRLLYSKKSELRPIKVPTLNDANTIRVPSLSEVVLLEQPSLDQIIIEFLKQYDVNVEPRSVGAWNGWDTLSTATSLFAKEGSTLNIASTMFMANRSNQVNSAAQDWGTWKRWALDHKNFDQYKDEIIQTINIHNENATKKVEEEIRRAEFHNKNATEELKKSIREIELHNENLLKKLKEPKLKEYVSELLENDNLRIANLQKRRQKISKIFFLLLLILFFLSIVFGLTQKPKFSNYDNRTKLENAKFYGVTKSFLSKGIVALNAGDFDIALRNLTSTKSYEPDLENINYFLGLTNYFLYLRDGKSYQANDAKKYLNKIGPKDPKFNLATELLKKIKLGRREIQNYYLNEERKYLNIVIPN